MTARKRVALLCLLFACSVLQVPCWCQYDSTSIDSSLNATASPDHIVLTWTESPATTLTVTWRSSQEIEDGWVDYRQAGAGRSAAVKVRAQAREFSAVATDRQGRFTLYSATLRNLRPDTGYAYRVFSGDRGSPEYQFSTLPASPRRFSFLIFGDSQPGEKDPPSYAAWHQTLSAAVARHPQARFAIHSGDLTDEGMNFLHWHNWFEAAGDILARLVFLPVIGNHDCVGELKDPAGRRPSYWIPSYLLMQFPVFPNGPDGLVGQAWSFDSGDAHLTVINSERAYGDAAVAARQIEWLDRDLSATKKRWKLVFFHRPPYYSRACRTNEEVRKTLCPVIEKHRADVVFSGHDHVFCRTYPMKDGNIFSSPADGTVYYITGRSGGYAYTDVSRKIWHAAFYQVQDQPCYLLCEIDSGRLTVRAYKTDGTVIDVYTIDKDRPERSTLTPAPARFSRPRFSLNGDLPPMHASDNGATALSIDGKWFVNARVFLGCLGGPPIARENGVELILDTREMTVPEGQARVFRKEDIPPKPGIPPVRHSIFVSADVIREFTGYDFTYDEALNVLHFSR